MKNFKKIGIYVVIFCISSLVQSQEKELQNIKAQYPTVLGKGGHGEIRADGADKNTVIKLSTQADRQCSEYKKEFDAQSAIYKTFDSFDNPVGLKQRATILKPIEYEQHKDFCFYKMERLKPFPNEQLLYQLYLGKEDHDKVIAGRGHYIGIKQLQEKLNDPTGKKLDQLIYDFGWLMGIIQLAAKFDALDFELVLSKVDDKAGYKMAIIDFDQMSSIADYFKGFDEKNIKPLVEKTEWVWMNEPYVPMPSGNYFKFFENGYLSVAKRLDTKNNTAFYTKVGVAIIEHFKEEME